MPTYIMLLSLTAEGRRQMLRNPDALLVAEQAIDVRDTGIMGQYAVLGEYDFVSILSAPNNESAARFSMELGVVAGLQITTLPAIPIGRFEEALSHDDPIEEDADAPIPKGDGQRIGGD